MDLEKMLEGSRYHEAGHAVAAHYNGFLVLRVAANEEEAITNWRGPGATTPTNCLSRACVTMAGQFADMRASWGEVRPESWEEFRTNAEDVLELMESGGANPDDHTEVLEDLERLVAWGLWSDREEAYLLVVETAQALVSEFWSEIEAVARALEPTGALDGPEVVQVIESSAPDREA